MKKNEEQFTVEKIVGDVKLRPFNILVEDTQDMEIIEYWEDRLERFGEDHAIVFVEKGNKVLYRVYCNTRKKGSVFK